MPGQGFLKSTNSGLSRRSAWNSSSRINLMELPKENGFIEKVDRKKSSDKMNASKTQNGTSESQLENLDRQNHVLAGLWNFQTRITKSPSMESLEKERQAMDVALGTFSDWMAAVERQLKDDTAQLKFLDLQSLHAKRDEIQVALNKAEEREKDLKLISKSFQRFAQLLPVGPERSELKQRISQARKRYYSFLALAVNTRETFRCAISLVTDYKEFGTKIRNWLDATEARSRLLVENYQDPNFLIENEVEIESIFNELSIHKDVYESFVDAGESIMDLKDNGLDELRQDLADVVDRWDALCLNIEKCLHRLLLAKKMAEDSKRSETERIEKQIRSESQRCTCLKPFNIVKVGDGKYTFGESKIVRLVRINGTSVVVRVGGGWEYLYDFLLKNDPCRATQIASKSGSHALNISGLDLTPREKSSEFSLTLSQSSQAWTPMRDMVRRHKQEILSQARQSQGSLGSAASSDAADCSDEVDSLSPTESISLSTPGSTSQESNTPRSRGRVGDADDREYSRESKNSAMPAQDLSRRLSNSTRDARRLSLVERQAIYAEKRKSIVGTQDLGSF